MLAGLFNYDNPVWRFIGKFADLIILNLLWVVCSLPVFTIGASTTAVYYVTLKLARDEDSYTIRSFFKSFKENFIQATAIWVIMLAVGLLLGFDLFYFIRISTQPSTFRNVMIVVFGALLIVYLAISVFIYPVQSRFYNPVKKTIFNAFFMSIRHILATIGMLVMDAAVILISFMIPQVMILTLLFGFPLLAFINSFFLNSIFAKYIPEQKRDADDELRPLFEDEEAVQSESADSEAGDITSTKTDDSAE